MRTLARNKRRFYYSNALRREPTFDEWGNETGEGKLVYSEPIQSLGNISSASGAVQWQVFGADISYDKVIIIEGTDSQINEGSVLWIDSEPSFDESGNPLFEYIVQRKSVSFHHTVIAVKGRSVS